MWQIGSAASVRCMTPLTVHLKKRVEPLYCPSRRRGEADPPKRSCRGYAPSAEIALCHLAHTLYKLTVYKISWTVGCECRLQCMCKAEIETK